MESWIKLYRKFADWEWFNVSEMVHLFIYLLISANHEDGKWRGVEVKRGQLLTGLHSLSDATGISLQTLRTCLNRLEKTQEINMQTNNQFRIITILKYDSYQGTDQITNKQTNKRLTSDQQATNKQLTTNKKEENKEKEKNNIEKKWDLWKKYKADEFKFKYKSQESEEAAKAELINLSGGNPEIAIQIIEQSMANGWKGFFKLKNNAGNQKNNTGATAAELAGLLASKLGSDRMQ